MPGLSRGCNMALLIDRAKLVDEKIALQGAQSVGTLQRLADLIVSKQSEIRYQLYSDVDRLSRPTIQLILEGTLEILCQRCMMPMPFKVSIDTTLTIFTSDAAIDVAEKDSPNIEGLVVTNTLDVAALIEDELILTLPYAPMHEQCDVEINVVDANKVNPWSKLAALKNKLNGW